MADRNLGAYNIADLREMALIGCRGVAALGPENLQFVDRAFRPAGHGRPSLKLLDSSRAVAEG